VLVRIDPLLAPAEASFDLPASKSAANRALIAAALSGGRWEFGSLTLNADIEAVLGGLEAFGYRVEHGPGGLVVGPGPRAARSGGRIDCGAAGTALRFLAAVAALLPGEWELTGSPRLLERPIEPLLQALRALGAAVHANGELKIRGRSADAVCPPILPLDPQLSSQFLSALLLIGAELDPAGLKIELTGPLTSGDYARFTARLLGEFGVVVRAVGQLWSVQRATLQHGTRALRLPADWGAMGVWSCLAYATGSRLSAPGLDPLDGQPDARLLALLPRLKASGPLEIDLAPCPDQFMNVAVLAAQRGAPTRLFGAANLRHKESDRLEHMGAALQALGAAVRIENDGLSIGGQPTQWRPAELDCAEDHRLAMAFTLHGLLVGGVRLIGADCVAKSYPRFFEHLESLRDTTRPVALVGQRGAGKSTLGRLLAQATGARFCDTDALFAAQHGPIQDFVDAQGWPRFRAEEERVLAEFLAPGRVLALGGGALQSERNRALLADQALVVWIDTPFELLHARLSRPEEVRPSVLGGTLAEELRALEARRRPLFEAAANVRVDGSLTSEQQIEQARRGLFARAPLGSPLGTLL
jgi:3-phosphoshikimate 1-carboxyvinyltransferase